MRLEDAELRPLLPSWMRDDAYDVAMAVPVQESIREVYQVSRLLTIWDHIDELPEAMLDEMAWALDIEWYEDNASIETKRDLVRSSDFVHMKKGTVEAVETVIRAYFGDGYLMEWPEYGGDPYHFKVFTANPTLVAENQLLFEDLLRKVKRHSAKLDSILIGLTGQEWVYLGSGVRDFAYERQGAGVDRIYVWGKAGAHEHEDITVRMGDTNGVTLEQAAEAMRY